MPSYSRPKGVRTLPTNDWFYQNGAAAAGQLVNSAGNDSQISLYNDANAGVWLFVYNMQVITQFGLTARYFTMEGVLGTFQSKGFPVVCDAGVPFGAIYGNYVPTPASYPNYPAISTFNPLPQAQLGGPFAVLKPGYSLVSQIVEDQITTFYYIAIGP